MDYKEFAAIHGDKELRVFVVNREQNSSVIENATLQFGVPPDSSYEIPASTIFLAIEDLLGAPPPEDEGYGYSKNVYPRSMAPALCGIVKLNNTLNGYGSWYEMTVTFNEIVAIVEAERERGRDQVD